MVFDDLSIAALTADSIPASFGLMVGGIWSSSCGQQEKVQSSEAKPNRRERK